MNLSYPAAMSDTFARIEKLENGFTVCVTDRVIAAENQKPKASWRDPSREYAFKDLKSALKWIADNEAAISPDETAPEAEYTGAWNEANSEKD
jgi:hypothetical protein